MDNENIVVSENENENANVFFEIEDESGIVHRLQMVSVFRAGNLNRLYVAGLTSDILLYRYSTSIARGDEYKGHIFEIDTEEEYARVADEWGRIFEAGIPEESLRTGKVYMNVPSEIEGVEEVTLEGTIFSVFPVGFGDDMVYYIAICPHNIMFFRYNLDEENGLLEISNIYNPQEYADVTEAFHALIEVDEQ